MIPRFTRTRNNRRRRLTLHHAAAMRRARVIADTMAAQGSFVVMDIGSGPRPYPRCLSRRRRAIAETWED